MGQCLAEPTDWFLNASACAMRPVLSDSNSNRDDSEKLYGVSTTKYRNGSSMSLYRCGASGGMITTSPVLTRCDSPEPINWPPSGVPLAAPGEAVPGVMNVAAPLMMTTTAVQSSWECSLPSSALPRLLV